MKNCTVLVVLSTDSDSVSIISPGNSVPKAIMPVVVITKP